MTAIPVIRDRDAARRRNSRLTPGPASSLKFTARRVREGIELMEFVCTENNQAGIAGGYKLNSEQR